MRVFFVATVVLVAASGSPGRLAAQDVLPDAPGRDVTALIAHREKNGPCKKLEDLKKIAGLEYKKIEARKEHLACM